MKTYEVATQAWGSSTWAVQPHPAQADATEAQALAAADSKARELVETGRYAAVRVLAYARKAAA